MSTVLETPLAGSSPDVRAAGSGDAEEPVRGRTRARGTSRVRGGEGQSSQGCVASDKKLQGYHSFVSMGRTFNVEERWTLGRELGQGAYGVVVAAEDKISGETVAIKLVTRVFEKVQLAKRILREITLLRFLQGHDNVTGLIDLDAPGSPHDFNEIYLFMEPMEADLHMIIRSGQLLTNEHCAYFVYQILRGMKYLHSGNIIHRDLKPGNLLVNADCELKIADFGLARSFSGPVDGETVTNMTEYVATRWYRAPEIMLSFKTYTTAIDVWSIGCILAEILLGKPIFKGKDYVDQINKILDIMGSPSERILSLISSDRAQAYMRSLPIKKTVSFANLMPKADALALDLLGKMLNLDPSARPSVAGALEHPWVATYHEPADEPEAPKSFVKWHEIEKLETIDQYRQAIWDEIHDYRREVRTNAARKKAQAVVAPEATPAVTEITPAVKESVGSPMQIDEPDVIPMSASELGLPHGSGADGDDPALPSDGSEVDPITTYARRSSLLQHQQPVAFPSAAGEPASRLLRTLSTVSVKDKSAAGMASNVRFGMTKDEERSADAPPTEFPIEFQTKASKARAAAAAAQLAKEATERAETNDNTIPETQAGKLANGHAIQPPIDGLPTSTNQDQCDLS
ncbi:kinase-like protein [Auriculariales sp. MPI-PUGE-AT-0066]|nr:kinase-like protein [Auriculariales sp. MPI-PUGE-AT-0066]